MAARLAATWGRDGSVPADTTMTTLRSANADPVTAGPGRGASSKAPWPYSYP